MMAEVPKEILFDPKTKTVVTEEWRAAVVESVAERDTDFQCYLHESIASEMAGALNAMLNAVTRDRESQARDIGHQALAAYREARDER